MADHKTPWYGWVFVSVIVVFVVIGGLTLITSPLWGLAMLVDYLSCRSQANAMHVDWSWGPLQECVVVVDGRPIPIGSYKVVRVESP